MIAPGQCQIIVDARPNRGSWNMALDEALLEASIEVGLCAARVYEWSEATVSLGYFQPSEEQTPEPLRGLPTVRRLSGGGAILHHKELTYSCVVPATHPLAREPHRLYDEVHKAILSLLSSWGIVARERGVAEPGRNAEFLCFGRGDAHDIVIDGQKIVGSAQRRRKGAVLQHGSLLLRRSEHAPEFVGAIDLVPSARLPDDANRVLAAAIGAPLGEAVWGVELDGAIVDRATALEASRYGSLDWRDQPA